MFPLCIVSFSGVRYNALFNQHLFSTYNEMGSFFLGNDSVVIQSADSGPRLLGGMVSSMCDIGQTP